MAKGKFSGQSDAVESSLAADTSKAALSSLESKSDTDKVVIVSEKRKGKTIMGIEKTPVTFDENGKATVTVKEAKYFLSVPGCELEGAKSGTPKKAESESKTDSVEETKTSEKEDK